MSCNFNSSHSFGYWFELPLVVDCVFFLSRFPPVWTDHFSFDSFFNSHKFQSLSHLTTFSFHGTVSWWINNLSWICLFLWWWLLLLSRNSLATLLFDSLRFKIIKYFPNTTWIILLLFDCNFVYFGAYFRANFVYRWTTTTKRISTLISSFLECLYT